LVAAGGAVSVGIGAAILGLRTALNLGELSSFQTSAAATQASLAVQMAHATDDQKKADTLCAECAQLMTKPNSAYPGAAPSPSNVEPRFPHRRPPRRHSSTSDARRLPFYRRTMLSFGNYPTAVELLAPLSSAATALWVKHDDQTNPIYGGNKVRKIGRLLSDAQARGKNSVVTIGAVGSHHVLTTGIFGRAAGMQVEAVVVGQPRTEHVLENVRADIAQGVRLYPASNYAHAAALLARCVLNGAYYIPAGGSNRIGAQAFVDAASELSGQVRRGEMPEPDLLVVAMGSGGTAAGLAAGLAKEGLRTKVLAVTVAEPAWFVERSVRALALECAERSLRESVRARLEQTRAYLGRGYGYATEAGTRATCEAAKVGLALDPTYTAKAFAAALDRVQSGSERTILYWHTLSSAPMAPLLASAPIEDALDARLLRLAQ
jgi:D-cysteine desulfhydrase